MAKCRTEGCREDPDNGEGYDGYCGNCADRIEVKAGLKRAHDALSEALEDPARDEKEIRRAAITMCDALNDFWLFD